MGVGRAGPRPPGRENTRRYLVRIAPETSLDSIAAAIGLPRTFIAAGERHLELPLNPALAARLEQGRASVPPGDHRAPRNLGHDCGRPAGALRAEIYGT